MKYLLCSFFLLNTVKAAELSGYLIDKQCIALCTGASPTAPCAPDGINVLYTPQLHTGWCKLLPRCVASGYVLLSDTPDSDGIHPIVLELAGNESQATTVQYIEGQTSGPFPKVVVQYDETIAETSEAGYPLAFNATIQDTWDDSYYAGTSTHQVLCEDATQPNVESNNLCFRSDVLVTLRSDTYVIESNGCPDHPNMQGSTGTVANPQGDFVVPGRNETSTEGGCGACGSCGAGCGSCSAGCGAWCDAGCGSCSAGCDAGCDAGCGACSAGCDAGCGACSAGCDAGCGAGCGACSAGCYAGCGSCSAGCDAASANRFLQGCDAGCSASCGANATTGCGAGCGSCSAGCDSNSTGCCAAGCGGGCCAAGCGGCGAAGCGGCGATGCGGNGDCHTESHGTYDPMYQHYTMVIPQEPGTPGEPTYLKDDDVVGIMSNGILLDTHKPTWSYDSCNGHSDKKHQYHYHLPPKCFLESLGIEFAESPDWWKDGDQVREYADMANQFPVTGPASPVIGWARDGFPIFGIYDDQGQLMRRADLDECNGKEDSSGNYGYYMTVDPPFAPPCLRGAVGSFSYFSTKKACPKDGIVNTILDGPAIAACETVPFADLANCEPVVDEETPEESSASWRLMTSASVAFALVAVM